MRIVRYGNVAHCIVGPVLNKSLEIGGGLTDKPTKRLDINLNVTTKGDHAGLRFYAGWFRFMIEFNFIDIRHWDYKKDRYA